MFEELSLVLVSVPASPSVIPPAQCPLTAKPLNASAGQETMELKTKWIFEKVIP